MPKSNLWSAQIEAIRITDSLPLTAMQKLDRKALADIAATIGKASATGLRQAKRCIDQGSELDPRGALAVELLAIEKNLAQDSQGDTWRTRMAGFKGATSQGST